MSSRLPRVSVVIPCYAQAHFLPGALESVLAQEGASVEAVVVDDGSPDDVRAAAARYPGVRYVHQRNQGLSAARNTGLRESSGDFVTWADDNPAAAFRRFQVRDTGDEVPPDVSNATEESIEITLEVRVAYPQTARTGRENALDRDDCIAKDWLKLNYTFGIYGAANFTGANDCTPLGATRVVDRIGKVDFLVVTARFMFYRSTT